MHALPPVTEIQIQRLDFLTTNHQIARSGLNCRERTALIFLMQTHLFNELAKANINTKQGYNYAKYANLYYEAFLKYNK